MTDSLLNVLLATDFWSTRQLLAACRSLPRPQFEHNFGLGTGSLQSTVTHLVGTLFIFADRLERRPPRPRLEADGQSHSAAELSELFERAALELERAVGQALADHSLDEPLNWTDDDKAEVAPEDRISYAVALAQMVDHGIHHRTQAMDMLRLLGHSAPMNWHPFDWDEAVRFGT